MEKFRRWLGHPTFTEFYIQADTKGRPLLGKLTKITLLNHYIKQTTKLPEREWNALLSRASQMAMVSYLSSLFGNTYHRSTLTGIVPKMRKASSVPKDPETNLYKRLEEWRDSCQRIGWSVGIREPNKNIEARLPTKLGEIRSNLKWTTYAGAPIEWKMQLHPDDKGKGDRVDLTMSSIHLRQTGGKKIRIDREYTFNEELYCSVRRPWILDLSVPCSSPNGGETWKEEDLYVDRPSLADFYVDDVVPSGFLPWVLGSVGNDLMTILSQKETSLSTAPDCFPARKAVTRHEETIPMQYRRAVAYLLEKESPPEFESSIPIDGVIERLSKEYNINIFPLDAHLPVPLVDSTRDSSDVLQPLVAPTPSPEYDPDRQSIFLYVFRDASDAAMPIRFVEPILWIPLLSREYKSEGVIRGSLPSDHEIVRNYTREGGIQSLRDTQQQEKDAREQVKQETKEKEQVEREAAKVKESEKATAPLSLGRGDLHSATYFPGDIGRELPVYQIQRKDGTTSSYLMGSNYSLTESSGQTFRNLYDQTSPHRLVGRYQGDISSGSGSVKWVSATDTSQSGGGDSTHPFYRGDSSSLGISAYTSYTSDASGTSSETSRWDWPNQTESSYGSYPDSHGVIHW